VTQRKVDLLCKDCGAPLTDDERVRGVRICCDCQRQRAIDKEELRESKK
jgi:hypothetical protein